MLLRQQRGGNQDRDLTPGLHALESGANGDFCFSKSNIAADQSIHWLGCFHVALSGCDGRELIRRLLPREGAFKFMLPWCVWRKRNTMRGRAHRLHAQHFRGKIAHRLRNAFFLRFPALSTNLAQRRLGRARSNIFLHQVHAQSRHMQLCAAFKLQREVFHFWMRRILQQRVGVVATVTGVSALTTRIGAIAIVTRALSGSTTSIKRRARDQPHILRHAVIAVRDIIALLKM